MASQVILERSAHRSDTTLTSIDVVDKCDLCHSRKVKCDRLDPCMNCVDAEAECRRARPRRSMRPRVSRISGLSKRLSTLEQYISNPHVPAASARQEPSRDFQASENNRNMILDIPPSSQASNMSTPKIKTAVDDVASRRPIETPAAVEDIATQQACEARRSIQQELRQSNHLSCNRRTILESALSLVNKISAPSLEKGLFHENTKESEDSSHSGLEEFTLETYFMMSEDIAHRDSPGKHLHWPDHVSVRSLEHMSLSLAEGRVDRQTSLHYRVCVYTKAILFLARLRERQMNGRLRNHVRMTRHKYTLAAFKALDQVDLSGTHSLSLVQALLSGALLHQMQGNPTKSWTLTAFAARLLVAMNYHNITNDTSVRMQEEEDTRFCLSSCYLLDKSLSMLLLRPPSLPRLGVSPVALIPMDDGMSLSTITRTTVELAEIQEAALELLYRWAGPGDTSNPATELDGMIQQLNSMKIVIEERRASSRPELQLDWMAVEFRYHAMVTTILQCKSRIWGTAQNREECLQHARHALEALSRLQTVFNEDSAFVGAYPMFLTWTVFSYPMTPFYILFCNVVGTSKVEDFQLMRDTTKGLYRFIDLNPAIGRLYHLFTQFLVLCSPLVEREAESTSPCSVQQNMNLDTEEPSVPVDAGTPILSTDNQLYNGSAQEGTGGTRSLDTTMRPEMDSWWHNAQMWELFGTQPSLEWVDSEITDFVADGYP
ncbi:Zn(II)2Cys6 transcription factor [Aspergillus brunneoviolaceus CBS 621.78]|uniref:Uncharacterized protein n=1 Tax=Aspergillus brunneoviolaceus CBS 621.78 TaxID=1450534 RepID=A0ACD1FX45_9EURO|nr:hypothetical protein BO95DRAFT_506373 [Aspergillus brunneoviolaceus CBS 621.78]RAH41577.1 hypothetical protein BO95DRAFT_506373 [Aspergillus brunneoviolaceus CBS 621.78]